MATISTSGISPSQIIKSEHLIRIINALDGTTVNDIIISGSLNALQVTGSFKGDGSQLTGITGEWDGTLNGNASITGSLTVTNGITGSLQGAALSVVGYVYEQASANVRWTINHNLNLRHPIVVAYDNTNFQIIPDSIEWIDFDNIELNFSSPIEGYARII